MEQNYQELKNDLPNAVAILILGILSIPACCFYGVGIVFAIVALVLAKSSSNLYVSAPEKYTESSYKNINAGKICAWIGLAFSLIQIISTVVVIIIFGYAALSDPNIILDYFGIQAPV